MMSMPFINECRFGRMTISGKPFSTDLIILPSGRVMDNWIRKSGHFLEYNDLKTLIDTGPEAIIVGTGISGRMKVDNELLSLLNHMDIKADVFPNPQAVELYNQKISTGLLFGACFHLTC